VDQTQNGQAEPVPRAPRFSSLSSIGRRSLRPKAQAENQSHTRPKSRRRATWRVLLGERRRAFRHDGIVLIGGANGKTGSGVCAVICPLSSKAPRPTACAVRGAPPRMSHGTVHRRARGALRRARQDATARARFLGLRGPCCLSDRACPVRMRLAAYASSSPAGGSSSGASFPSADSGSAWGAAPGADCSAAPSSASSASGSTRATDTTLSPSSTLMSLTP